MGDDEEMQGGSTGFQGGLAPGAPMSAAQAAHMQQMGAFMSALDSARDRAAMGQFRANGLQPGTAMASLASGGAGASGSMARAGILGGPQAMLMSAMRHPPRMSPMKAIAHKPVQPPMSAGQKAGAFLNALDLMKTAQRLGQGERPKPPVQGATVGGVSPVTSAA